MTDRQTRETILKNPNLPIHNSYRGVQSAKEILELLLMGYAVSDIAEELGMNRSSVQSSVKRIKTYTGHSCTRKMVRDLVASHRGYL